MKFDGLKCQVRRIRKVIQGIDLYNLRQSTGSCEQLADKKCTKSDFQQNHYHSQLLLQQKEINNNTHNNNSHSSTSTNHTSHNSNFYEDIENWDLASPGGGVVGGGKMMAGMIPHSSSSSSGQYGHLPPSPHHHHQIANSSAGIVATLHGGGGGGGINSGGGLSSTSGGSGVNSSVEDTERLFLSESDVIHLLLEFLSSRGLTSAQVELERETGIVNEVIASPDLIFLRSLIVDGRWDDVTEFLQPLEEAFRSFPGKKVKATILKHRFLDILASYAGPGATINAGGTFTTEDGKSGVVEDLVKV